MVTILYQNGNIETFETANARSQATTPSRVQNQNQTTTAQTYQNQQQTQRTTQPNQYQSQSQRPATQYQPQNQRAVQPNQYNQYQDVVYLKNGSIIRGVIIEQIPNNSITIQTADGNVFIYRMDEVETISKIPLQSQRTAQDYRYQTRQTMQSDPYSPYYQNINVDYSRMSIDAPDLYQLYQSGKRRGGSGWFFIITGIAANGVGIGLLVDGMNYGYQTNAALGYISTVVGDVLICVGIPMAIGGKVRRVKAKKAYEQRFYSNETTREPQFKINLHGNGLGLAYVF